MKYYVIQQGKQLMVTLFILAGCGLFLIFSQEARNSAVQGHMLCGQVVIPSLFVFLCLCQWLMNSSGIGWLTRYGKPLFRLLLGSYWQGGTAWLMAVIGGYPMGAVALKQLLAQGMITEEQAKRLTCFLFVPSPAFVITAVGGGLLNSAYSGVLLWESCIIASLVITVVGCRVKQVKSAATMSPLSVQSMNFTEGVASACQLMLQICGMVVLFRVVIGFLPLLSLPVGISDWVAGILEVTNGCVVMSRYGLPVLAAVLGFGGISAHWQIKGLAGELLPSYSRYSWVRVLQGLLSYMTAHAFCLAFPNAVSTMAIETATAKAEVSWLPAIGLMITCIIFLYSLQTGTKKECKK